MERVWKNHDADLGWWLSITPTCEGIEGYTLLTDPWCFTQSNIQQTDRVGVILNIIPKWILPNYDQNWGRNTIDFTKLWLSMALLPYLVYFYCMSIAISHQSTISPDQVPIFHAYSPNSHLLKGTSLRPFHLTPFRESLEVPGVPGVPCSHLPRAGTCERPGSPSVSHQVIYECWVFQIYLWFTKGYNIHAEWYTYNIYRVSEIYLIFWTG